MLCNIMILFVDNSEDFPFLCTYVYMYMCIYVYLLITVNIYFENGESIRQLTFL